MSHLYEIPITLILGPTRKHMPQVAPHRGNTGNRQGAAIDVKPGTGLSHSWFTSKRCAARGVYRIRRAVRRWELQMLDLIMLAIGLAFFALSVGYTIACDRL